MRVARAALHFWEEPPISGSVGSGTIFFSGCPLRCVYCQNVSISQRSAGRTMSASDVAQACLDLQAQGALNINMVTPTHFAPSVREAVALARREGLRIPLVWNTSGYETVSAIRENAGIVDIYLTDMKYADADLGAALSGVADYPAVAMAALDEMVRQTGVPCFDGRDGHEHMVCGVVVRHMVLPGHTDDSIAVVRCVHERFGNEVRLSLMRQYTPVLVDAAAAGDVRASAALERFPELGRALTDDEYECVLDAADKMGVEDYFWQDGAAASESFIPDFGVQAVPRYGDAFAESP